MATCAFLRPIYSDQGVLHEPSSSGGSWRSTLPFSNTQDRRLSLVARSTDATTASTQREVDLKVARTLGGFFGIFPNITSAGTVRVRTSNVAGDFDPAIYDSGAITVWPAGETLETLGEIKPVFIKIDSTPEAARYVLWEIDDTANPDGHLDVARLGCTGIWQPSKNMRYGAKFGLSTATERLITEGGAATYNEKPRRRHHQIEIANLPDSESRRSAFDMQRIAGTHQQMWFVPDPDSELLWLESYLCTLQDLSFLEHTLTNKNAMAFSTFEEL